MEVNFDCVKLAPKRDFKLSKNSIVHMHTPHRLA
ncbi:hypothetical protein C8J31_105140 [Rhizobium sp. PP-CC-2G-626]|nr:hypothetical protein C8J31_105140 [Rhizobium sp. PP-CC-2G-626]